MPLRAEWSEGQELQVESAELAPTPHPSATEVDQDFGELAAVCSAGAAEDDERLAQALDEARCLARALVRRQMRLP